MKHLRLFLLMVAVMAMQVVTAKPKTKVYTNDMIRIEVPADFTAEEENNIVSFDAQNDNSKLSLFMVNYLCMEVISSFDEEQIGISLSTAVRTFTTKIDKEFMDFNCTDPAREKGTKQQTYYSSYTATTSAGKSVKGYVRATIHNGCMFMGVTQHENKKVYEKWVKYLHTLEPINTAEKETKLNRKKKDDSYASSVPLTKTYTSHGITFNHPENMLINESEGEDGEIQIICNYVGDHTAVMNINFTVNPIFALTDNETAQSVCATSVQEMATKLTSIYASAKQSEILSDSEWPYPNKYTEFEGEVFGMKMKGRLEAFLMGSCFVVVVQQAETDETFRMLQSVKQTIKRAE